MKHFGRMHKLIKNKRGTIGPLLSFGTCVEFLHALVRSNEEEMPVQFVKGTFAEIVIPRTDGTSGHTFPPITMLGTLRFHNDIPPKF